MFRSRNTGLDIARLAAMAMVWVCHSGYFAVGISYEVLSFAGVVCVEIFFVLSGLLVGRGMILAVTGDAPGRELKRFYVNRICRTLPLYYLLLVFVSLSSGRAVRWSYWVFLQNFFPGDHAATAPLWTLPIEIWYYFLTPPVLLGLYRLLRRRFRQEGALVLALAVLYALPLGLRCLQAPFVTAWDAGIRKQLLLRLDSVMTGMLLAALKLYRPAAYEKLGRNPLCILGSLGGIAGLYLFYCRWMNVDGNLDNSVFWKIFLFTLVPLLCALGIVYLENARWIPRLCGKWLSGLISLVCTLGYGIYLVHMPVFEWVSGYFTEAGFLMSWIGFAGSIALSAAIALVLYIAIEHPLTRLCRRRALN